jgi:signal transduction histidine kinase/CheY-like chemotaxis protein
MVNLQMKKRIPGFEDDLQISLPLIIFGEILITLALFLTTTTVEDQALQNRFRLLRVVMILLPLTTWLLNQWKAQAARWFTVLGSAAILELAFGSLGFANIEGLRFIPVALAAAVLNMPSALAIALGETSLLAIHSPSIAGTGSLGFFNMPLIGIWVAYGLMVLVYQPIQHVRSWSWQTYQQALELAGEARDRQATLEQALEDVAHANRQLSLLNERLTVLRAISEEAQKAKADFVAKVSHEFRTPLNMIIGLVGVMVETPHIYGRGLSAPVLEDLKIVYRNCEHLLGLVNDVLALSQAQAGKLSLHKERVNLVEIVKEALVVVNPLVKKKKLLLNVTLPDVPSEITCDRTRIRQVILNLVSNAVRYTDQGKVEVQVEERLDRLLVSVLDTGPGIQPEDQERIFEPFCQGTLKTWRDKEGSGLGLTISKQFIELHGGRIWLDSAPGVGTTFYFDLPKVLPVIPDGKPERWLNSEWVWRERTTRPHLSHETGKPRVLVCDETGGLESNIAGYSPFVEIVNLKDLPQVIEEVKQCPAHLVVWNTNSFNHLGDQLFEIRQKIPNTPLIGCAIPPQINWAAKLGILAYLLKPIRRASLEDEFRKLAGPIRRVLIAEDDADTRQLLTLLLRAYDENILVECAANGQEALELLRTTAPDILLLDLTMPEIDGFQLIKIKNQEAEIAPIPVIVISAQDLRDRPRNSDGLLLTIDQGISFDKLIKCSLEMSATLLNPD